MLSLYSIIFALPVALLAEGVDRNHRVVRETLRKKWSPSSRRAWIEISALGTVDADALVALLAEGVDRNLRKQALIHIQCGRPPRGGRG